MKSDTTLGPAFPDLGWVPAPRYLMRRNRIMELTGGVAPGKLLEIGPGAGTLLAEFASNGFACEALESSQEARTMVERIAQASRTDIVMHSVPGADWNARFDYVFAFDVLEHIEDDVSALALWGRWLGNGGTLLLSVPARMNLWTAGDEWAGHYRRYERNALIKLIESAGLKVEHFECYGFPLTNITEMASAPLYRRSIRNNSGSTQLDRQQNNDRSGTDRRLHLFMFRITRSHVGKWAMRMLYRIQSRFLKRDIGTGYIVVARVR